MVNAWSDITANQVVEQIPGYAYGIFTASGTIYKGQPVYLVADKKVKVGGSAQQVVGVAQEDATDGDEVAVYGIGCIVNTRISSTSDTAGTAVGALDTNGFFSSDATNKCAIVVKAASTNRGEGQVLLTGTI